MLTPPPPIKTADEMLNQGWWRFTDPETSWQYFWNEVTNLSQVRGRTNQCEDRVQKEERISTINAIH